MARTVVRRDSHFPDPDPPDHLAFRTWGDGFAGELVAARIQGYSSADLGYVDVAVDSSGNLKLAANVTVDIGVVDQGAAGAAAWKVDGSAVTQPVSAASLPLPSGAAKDSTLTDGSQRVGGTVAVSGSLGRSWTLGSGTDTVNVGNLPATQPVSGSLGRSWTLGSGSDSVAAVQSGTWNVTEQATAAPAAALPALLKIDGGYDTNAAAVQPLPLQRVDGLVSLVTDTPRAVAVLNRIEFALNQMVDVLTAGGR